MKSNAFMFALVADQVSSRLGPDRVPLALAALSPTAMALPFERTAGDELQGLCNEPAAVTTAVSQLTRLGDWRIGIGVGPVASPLPDSTRAARGPAYVAARTAIERARRSPVQLALALTEHVSAADYPELTDATTDAETALWLWRSTLSRRSTEGWELMDLLDQGLTKADAAAQLGISPSAVSQRLGRAAAVEDARGAALATRLLARVQELGGTVQP
ncbi:MAG TPA: transposase [Propionicimonas sp.]|nr:transposase [Propionicimonas sp.]HQA78508.1 transposase [Propionicimonas sp.]HQD97754.1 transposase [Propionicimonas sp.]